LIEQEEILMFMEKEANKPVSLAEIGEYFGIAEKNLDSLRAVLKSLEDEGKIVRIRKGKYAFPERLNMLVGRLQGHPRGYGFVLVEGGDDVYISANNMHGAMHNDRVLIRINSPVLAGKAREGEVVRILARANEQVVGTYTGTNRYGFVVPEEKRIWQDIFIPGSAIGEARSGDLVVAAITRWPQDKRNPEGEIVEVIGHKGAPGIDILGIIKKYHLEVGFPELVLREAGEIPAVVKGEEIIGRTDLRQLQTVTIDSEDARDLDDALSIERKANGNYLLGVHIADVGHYVLENSEIDKEARKRGCSVYFPDRVIPMLPPRLSNGICSLNEGEDRLAMTVFIEVDPRGTVVFYEIRESVIKVARRLTYSTVREIIAGNEEIRRQYSELVPDLELMEELRQVLKERRRKRGSIDFNFREKKVKLDAWGRPVEIELRERSVADEMVEEFMVLANEVIAEHVYWLNLPFIYRVHEKPNPDDLTFLREFLHNLGYSLRSGGRIGPKDLQGILSCAQGKPEERLVSEVVLRSLKRARYSADCLGHFGLATKFYTHFTSPIRRYPDLTIHRIIKAMLRGTLDEKQMQRLVDKLTSIAEEASQRERISEEAEQETVDLKVVEYMQAKEGQIFAGVISGVMPFGIFVQLPNGVEGLVHVSNMIDDYYHYLEKHLALQGERTKKRYRIGDEVRVQLTKVNLADRTIDFELVEDREPATAGGDWGGSRRSGRL
jgi:ribonuclease R